MEEVKFPHPQPFPQGGRESPLLRERVRVREKKDKMKILIIGGTRFLGRHLVESARARGHEVTLFNRGKSNPTLFPQVETILGDREHDLEKLTGRAWDAVIDVAGYLPRIVRLSATGLERSVGRYVFISSISAYADFKKIGINESDP